MRLIETSRGNDIEVGTQDDDARLLPDVLFIRTVKHRRDPGVLTQAQALELCIALLDTVSELGETGTKETT